MWCLEWLYTSGHFSCMLAVILQGYALCVLDYEFQILDNAFLVHKPGIKTMKKDPQRAILAGKTNALIRKVIFPELKVLYGTRKGCAVWPRLDSANLKQVHALNMMWCYTFVNFPTFWSPACYWRRNTKHTMILWHCLFQMFPEICRSQDCVCIIFEFMGIVWIFFTDFSYYVSVQMTLQLPVYQT